MVTETPVFESAGLLDLLDARDLEAMDDLDFGVVVMDRAGTVIWYNAHEAAHTGFDPARVIGKDFFESVGPCMNNNIVAKRYDDDEDLDAEIDYVFTNAMKPTPVRLRMLARRGSARQYLAVRFP